MAKHKKKRGEEHEEHADERWLVSYSDMMTLLMALFLILWSMASVNTSKFEALSASLKEAFSGKILPGGAAVMNTGSSSDSNEKPTAEDPIQSMKAITPTTTTKSEATKASEETEELKKLKKQIDEWTRAHGLSRQVETQIARRGLIIRVLTDDVLFDSGSATIKPGADQLLDQVSRLLKTQVTNPIQVEGNTDNVPVSGRYPSNWELSTARATEVTRNLIRRGVWAGRLGATGYASEHPIASNETEAGRKRNRRVEIVVLRKYTGQGGQTQAQGGTK